ncbi:hypothetical protein BH10PSE7_BH10PSE7_23420 [soil metagenome]
MTTGSDLWPAQGETHHSAFAFRSLAARIAPDRPSPGDVTHVPAFDIPAAKFEFAASASQEHSAAAPAVLSEAQLGDSARALLDIMAATGGSAQPHERAFASDMLARLVPRLPLKARLAVAERVSLMENAPPLLLRDLIWDRRIEVAGPLLEKSPTIGDADLLAVIAENDLAKQRMIARRRMISQTLAAGLITTGDSAVLLTLIRNPGASFSSDSFHQLCLTARGTPSLQAPLATRTDTPATIAFELFWCLPPELRRYTLSRFLTDSENLNRIMKIGQVIGIGDALTGDTINPATIDGFLALVERGDVAEAATTLARLSGIGPDLAIRILSDPFGEPLAVMLKALGLNRTGFAEAVDRLQASPAAALRATRNPEELRTIFDSLSHNKARVVLTYWGWGAGA